MKLIVGLGNPGEKYAGNRHNIGFMAVDEIGRGYGFGPWKKRFQGYTAEGQIGLEKCILLKPSTYMNESGRAVGEAMRFYKLPLGDVIVIHDEIDLKPGAIRVKKGGGNAGHNGLKSISAHIGNEYVRVRLGVDHPGDKTLVATYVLQDFAKSDRQWLVPLLEGVARGMAKLVEGSEAAFLSEAARGRAPSMPAAKALNGAGPVVQKEEDASSTKVQSDLGEAVALIAAAASRTMEPIPAPPVTAGGSIAPAAMISSEAAGDRDDAAASSRGIDRTALEAEQAMQALDPVMDGAAAAAAAHEAELYRAQASEPLFEPVPEDAGKETEAITGPRRLSEPRAEGAASAAFDIEPKAASRAKSEGGFFTRWFRKRLWGAE